MDSERPWKTDAVLLLGAGILIGFGLLSGIGIYIHKLLVPDAKEAYTTFDFFLGTFGFHLMSLPLVHVFLRYHRVTWRELLGVGSGPWIGRAALAAATALLVLFPALGLKFLSTWALTNAELAPEDQAPLILLRQMEQWNQILMFGLAAVLLAPVVEEVLFRGILYSSLQQQTTPALARWVSSLFFAAFHLNLATFLSLTLFALALVWLFDKTRTLYAPILAHSLFNALNFGYVVWQTMLAPAHAPL